LFTSIEKKDWEFLAARHPFKDEDFMKDWLPGIVKHISKTTQDMILPLAKADVPPTEAQEYLQRLIFKVWRVVQYGEQSGLPDGFFTYEDFVGGGAAVDSAIGAVCCPYLSSLGIYSIFFFPSSSSSSSGNRSTKFTKFKQEFIPVPSLESKSTNWKQVLLISGYPNTYLNLHFVLHAHGHYSAKCVILQSILI
jgi:hypothetical protein